MRITKQQIIEAIRTEPLSPGFWIQGDDAACAVCAVGGVLRAAGCGPEKIRAIGSELVGVGCVPREEDPYLARRLVSEGQYLAALSCVFEGLAIEHLDLEWCEDVLDRTLEQRARAGDAAREPLIAFVEETFPDSIEIV
jgi:hypothetical protein